MSKKIRENLSLFLNNYKKWQYVSCHSLIAVICCYITLSPIIADMGQDVFYLLCLLSLYTAQQFTKSWSIMKKIVTGKLQAIITLLLCLYTVLSVSGMFFLEDNYKANFPYPIVIYVPLSLIWIIPVACWLITVVYRLLINSCNTSSFLSLKQQVIAILILVCFYCIWLYAFNPAITSYDSEYFFHHAHVLGKEPMEDWHPPFYAMILSVLLKICDSVSFIIILQYITFSIVFVRCLQFLVQIGIKKKFVFGIYIIIGFGINNALLLTTLWIDIPYMICLLGLTLLIAKAVLVENACKSIFWHVYFIIASVGASMFRQNGLIVVLIICCILPFIIKAKRKMLVSSLLVLCTVLLIKGPVYNYYGVTSCPGLKYLALANDIISTYYAGEEVSDEVIEMAENIRSGYNNFKYNPYAATANTQALGKYSVIEFIEIYMQNFFSHPKTVLEAFIKRNSPCWSICKPIGSAANFTNYKLNFHGYHGEYSYPYRLENKLTKLLSDFCDNIANNSLANVFYWRSSIYILVLLYFLFCLWLLAKKQIHYYIPFLPIFFNNLTLFAASGWSDYRYYWPTFIISMFLNPYCAAAIHKIKENSNLREDTKNDNKEISR